VKTKNYTIVIATVSEWLQNLAPVFQTTRSEKFRGAIFASCDWSVQLIWSFFLDSHLTTAQNLTL